MPTLYFSPMSGSLAARVAAYHYGVALDYVEVDLPGARFRAGGGDYREVHPLGQVPALRLDDGPLVTEIPVVLRTVASLGGASPPEDDATELSWLVFLGTEVHKAIFRPHFDPDSNDDARAYAKTKVPSRFAFVDAALKDRDALTGHFGVADIYLGTLLGWTRAAGIDLEPFPALRAALSACRERPAFQRAVADELPLLKAARARVN